MAKLSEAYQRIYFDLNSFEFDVWKCSCEAIVKCLDQEFHDHDIVTALNLNEGVTY